MRRATTATDTTVSTTTIADAEAKIAPVIALLEQPLLQLREALGTNTSADPHPDAVTALTSASTATRATEDPQRLGLYALESTQTAAVATPALRRTATEVSDAGGRGEKLSTLLGQAHATQSSAAAKVDAIIADFRTKAKAAAPAVNATNLDAIVALAEEAISEAVTVVGTANTDMDTHTRDSKALATDLGGTNGVTLPPGATEVSPGVYVLGTGGTDTSGTSTLGAYTGGSTTSTGDPAIDAQIALQNALISGGVSLGTAAIDAGVSFGTHLIDKIAEVAMHGIDTGAELATTGIDTLAAGMTGTDTGATSPSTLTPGATAPTTSGGGANSGGLFAGLGAGAATSKPEAPAAADAGESAKPEPAKPAPSFQAPKTEIPLQQAPANSSPAPATPAPGLSGGVVPPAAGKPATDQETERPSAAPKHGQPGAVPATA